MVLERDESDDKEQLADEDHRYITKAQLDEAVSNAITTVLSMFQEEDDEEDKGEKENETNEQPTQPTRESNNDVLHSEGGTESHEA